MCVHGTRTWNLADDRRLGIAMALSCPPSVAGLGVHRDAHAQIGVVHGAAVQSLCVEAIASSDFRGQT